MKLSLSYPVTPYSVNQGFGVNYFTYKQFGLQGHNGLDLMAYHGQPVYASHDGIVTVTQDSNEGSGVSITTTEKYEYDGYDAYFKTVYWHFCSPTKEPQFACPLKDGQKVKRGDLIGYADNTGFSTGDHLHFALKPVGKPTPDSNFSYNLLLGNGYLGAIDPTPYLMAPPKPGLPLPLRKDFASNYAYYMALFYYYASKIIKK